MSDATFKLVVANAQTGSGNQDITSSGFGTPDAVMAIMTNRATTDGQVADVLHSIGMTDGTTQGNIGLTNEDGVTAEDCSHAHDSVNFLKFMDIGAPTTLRSATATLITDGIRLNWNTTGSAYRIMFVFIKGTNNISCVHHNTDGGSIGSESLETVGFQTKLCFALWCDNDDSPGGNNPFSFGAFEYNGSTITQRAQFFQNDNGATIGDPSGQLSTDRFAGTQDVGGAGDHIEYEVTTVNTTQIGVTPRNATPVGDIILLAMDFDQDAEVGSVDSPNSAGSDWTVNLAGAFEPQMVGLQITQHTSEDTGVNSDAAGQFAHCVFDDTLINTAGFCCDQGSGNTHSESEFHAQLFGVTTGNSVPMSTAYDMDNPTMDSDGWTFAAADITTANGTTHKWFYWAVEVATPPPAGGVPIGSLPLMGIGR